jgi:hypothetical protein
MKLLLGFFFAIPQLEPIVQPSVRINERIVPRKIIHYDFFGGDSRINAYRPLEFPFLCLPLSTSDPSVGFVSDLPDLQPSELSESAGDRLAEPFCLPLITEHEA